MQAPSDWEIRRGRDGDVQEVVDLLRTCLGEGSVPRNAAFWRWKHEGNPFGPSPVLVATAGGRIVGVRAFLRWSWNSAGTEVPAVRAVDTATHPDWRGRGIFSRLTRQLVAQVAEEGAAFVFNTPNRKSGAGYRKMGWRSVGRLPVYVRPLRASALLHLAGAGRRTVPSIPAPLQPVSAFLERPESEAFLARVDGARRDDPRLRTAMTPGYLRWRYGDVPGVDYRAVWSGRGESAAALVLRPRRRRGLLEVSVSEVLADNPASVDSAAGLLRDLGASTAADYSVAIATSGTPEHAALRKAGFHRLAAAGPRLVALPLTPVALPPNPRDAGSWRLTAGSFELF